MRLKLADIGGVNDAAPAGSNSSADPTALRTDDRLHRIDPAQFERFLYRSAEPA
jgi:hypothetical protein